MFERLAKHSVEALVASLPQRGQGYLYNILRREMHSVCPNDESHLPAVVQALAVGDFGTARRTMIEYARRTPIDTTIAAQLRRIDFLEARSIDEYAQANTREFREVVSAMNDEIRSVPKYVPSSFWETIGNFHYELLERYGVENFKRTVSHSYQNWLMTSLDEPQVRRILELWPGLESTEPWFNTIEIPSHVGFHLSLDFNKPFYPLAFAEMREVYRIAVSILWEYVKNGDRHGILHSLEESEFGNPVRIHTSNGTRISSDIAHSVRERNLFLDTLGFNGTEGLTVAELGAGQGRLAEVLGKSTNYRYLIFDITPALYVSQWYVKKLFPEESIFEFRHFERFEDIREELEQSRFAFFTANQIEKFPDASIDLFLNMNSLMEMAPAQIENYLVEISRLTRTGFFSRQWFRWTNSIEHHTVEKDDFRLPAPEWSLALDATDDIYPEFFNQLWRRRR